VNVVIPSEARYLALETKDLRDSSSSANKNGGLLRMTPDPRLRYSREVEESRSQESKVEKLRSLGVEELRTSRLLITGRSRVEELRS
jgi:hypothetical protein